MTHRDRLVPFCDLETWAQVTTAQAPADTGPPCTPARADRA
ncbi:hypothetical protein [uncultured Amnibacterium sp.]